MAKFIVSQDGPYRAEYALPPSPALGWTDYQYTDTDLGLPASAGGGYLLGQALGTEEESGQLGLTPEPHIAVALQATALSLTAGGGTAHRPGVRPRQGEVRAQEDEGPGGHQTTSSLGACYPVFGRLAAVVQDSLHNYKGQSVYQGNELVGRASGPCRESAPSPPPGPRGAGARGEGLKAGTHLITYLYGWPV